MLNRKFASLVLQYAHLLLFSFTDKCISLSKLSDASLDFFSEEGLPRLIRSLLEQRDFGTETMQFKYVNLS
jgi:hypothetical protein